MLMYIPISQGSVELVTSSGKVTSGLGQDNDLVGCTIYALI